MAAAGLLITVGITAGFSVLILLCMAAYAMWFWHRRQALAERDWAAEIAKKEREAAFCAVPSRHGILSWNSGRVEFWTRTPAAPAAPRQISAADTSGTDTPAAEPAAEPAADALSVLQNVIFLGLYGMQGAGKSTMLQHLIHSRRHEQQIIIDPHGLPSDYCGVVPVGIGRNYQEIDECLENLIAELNSRYSAGHYNHERLNIYIDELTLLHRYCGKFKEFMPVVLTECRKINFRIIACMHSRRAKILGLEGSFDLAEGLRFLELKIDNAGHRWGELEDPRTGEKNKLTLPGPYIHTGTSQRHGRGNTHKTSGNGFSRRHDTAAYLPLGTGQTPVVIESEPLSRVYESRDEKRIVEMWRDGASMNQIAREVWGSSNGRRTAQIKGVLGNYGYDFS